MDLKWVVADYIHIEEAKNLAGELEIPFIAAKILVSRGVINSEQANSFLNPTLNMLFDPFIMHGMEKGIDRVIQALAANATIPAAFTTFEYMFAPWSHVRYVKGRGITMRPYKSRSKEETSLKYSP